MTTLPLEKVTPMVPPGGAGIGMHVIPVEKAIDMNNESISIDCIEKLRDEQHFDSLEDLQKQLTLDAIAAQAAICHSS